MLTPRDIEFLGSSTAGKEIEFLASAAHEVNRLYCISIGDNSQEHWETAPEWQRDSARKGVEGVLSGNTPKQSHRCWLAEKERTGWRYGLVKDPVKKEHPCMVPYDQLPEAQKKKDEIFVKVVRVLIAYALRRIDLLKHWM